MARQLEPNERLVIEKLKGSKYGLRFYIETLSGTNVLQLEHIGTIREGIHDLPDDLTRAIEMILFVVGNEKPYLIREETTPKHVEVMLLEAKVHNLKNQLLIGDKSA